MASKEGGDRVIKNADWRRDGWELNSIYWCRTEWKWVGVSGWEEWKRLFTQAKVKRSMYCSKFPTDAEVMKMKVEEIWMSKCSFLLENRAVRLIHTNLLIFYETSKVWNLSASMGALNWAGTSLRPRPIKEIKMEKKEVKEHTCKEKMHKCSSLTHFLLYR